MKDIAGRTAFITGGANGIGLGIARALARTGAKVALVDLDAAALEAAKAELSKTTAVFVAKLDVRDRESYATIAQQVEAALGPVTILVNNAGVAGGSSLDKLNYDVWDWGVGINLNGVYNGVRTFVPKMMERKQGGHVVNTASGAGLVAGDAGALYHATKFAVVGLSESMRHELAPRNIGVSVLCPGPVATGIVDRTRTLQPNIDMGALSPEQIKTLTERYKMITAYLQQGMSPDTVGDLVLDAILNDKPYIQTTSEIRPMIAARHQAIMDSIPD
jgi:NAD(P)-dependent dehydrogenase (short-subunit alcohol dehydrogenase family)